MSPAALSQTTTSLAAYDLIELPPNEEDPGLDPGSVWVIGGAVVLMFVVASALAWWAGLAWARRTSR